MLRMDLRNAKPGMKLALPVKHPANSRNILLKRGYALTDKTITRLPDMGVRYVWVSYPALKFVEDFISPEVLESQSEVVTQIEDCFENLQSQSSAKVNYESYTSTIGRMVENLLNNTHAAIFMGDIAHGHDNTLLRHSSNVSYLSLLMGLKLEGYIVKQRKHINPAQAKEMTNLGVGAMLHDVGILHLPDEVRRRYAETEDESDKEWQEHPSLGFREVRGHVEPSAATVVLNHHQRFDSTGYAGKDRPVLGEERIHIFARIAGAAEQFDRLHYPAVGSERTTVEALRMMIQPEMMAKFDPRVLRALFTVVPPYPPGSILKLSDGKFATTVDHVPTNPCRPVIQIIPDPALGIPDEDDASNPQIELAEVAADLYIAECDGVDVSGFNFHAPEFMTNELLALNWF